MSPQGTWAPRRSGSHPRPLPDLPVISRNFWTTDTSLAHAPLACRSGRCSDAARPPLDRRCGAHRYTGRAMSTSACLLSWCFVSSLSSLPSFSSFLCLGLPPPPPLLLFPFLLLRARRCETEESNGGCALSICSCRDGLRDNFRHVAQQRFGRDRGGVRYEFGQFRAPVS